MMISILGTFYTVLIKKYDEDKTFEEMSIGGYCDGNAKEIVVCDYHTLKGWENAPERSIIQAQRETLRHEIVHAFFNESGLKSSSNCYEDAWAKNEEMIDWIAIQGEKIYKAWKEAEAV